METEINEVKEPSTKINDKLSIDEVIERFAEVQKISIEEAKELISADTEEEVMKKITDFTLNKIHFIDISFIVLCFRQSQDCVRTSGQQDHSDFDDLENLYFSFF